MIKALFFITSILTTASTFAGGIHCRECPAEDDECFPRPSCSHRTLGTLTGPIVPDGSYPKSDCVKVGPACAGFIQGPRLKQVNVRYDNNYANSVGVFPYGANIIMEATLNGYAIDSRSIRGGNSRAGCEFQIVLPPDAGGDLAIFFRDSAGKNYDSDYGRNFHFTLY